MPMLDAAEWPLRGREDELRAIVDAVDRAGGVLLAGPAGVGKTRLAREALAAVARSRPARLVRATESSRTIPLGALAPLLGGIAGSDTQLLARAHAALRAEPSRVLGIDDAHLLDPVSATLVHQLVGERALPVVVTIRTGEPAPGAVTALWKDGLLRRLDVAALSADQTAALLESALGGQLHTDSARRLHAATSGNVLWLRQLVDGELHAGRLSESDGLWTWTGEPRLTPALTDLIDARIGPLVNGVRPVVELVALGEPLDLDGLAILTDRAGVDEAITRGLVTVLGERPEARLAHPLFGEVVRARIGEADARRLRGLLATTLAATAPDELLRRALLVLDSDLDPDPKLLVDAADRAVALTDLDLAIRLLERACAAGAGFDAALTLAYTLSYLLRPEEAEAAFATASDIAGTETQRLRVAQARAINLLFVLGRPDDALHVIDEAARRATSGVALLGFRATAALLADRLGAAESAARELRSAADPPAHATATAGWAMAVISSLTGRAAALPGVAAAAVGAALAMPETAPLRINIAFVEVFGLAVAGQVGEVRARIDNLAGELEGLFALSVLPIFDGVHSLATGRVATAARQLRQFRPYFPGYGGGYTTWFESLLGMACGMSGDAPGARECIVRAESSRLPGERLFGPQLELARAWAAAAEGGVTAAAAAARTAAELAAGSGQWAVEVLARDALLSFGDCDQAPRLRKLAGLVDGPRAELVAAHAEALDAGDPDALLGLCARFESAELLSGAAECAAHAAELLRRRGDTARAIGAATRATTIARDCGLRTPALADAQQPSPLSSRQREIAMLAATLSNAEIAERLGVSVRTIEGHVYHACVRLGLANRGELAVHVTGTVADRRRGDRRS